MYRLDIEAIYFLLLLIFIPRNTSVKRHFVVKQGARHSSDETIIAMAYKKSKMQCAANCMAHKECCSSTYENTTGTCSLHASCCPGMQFSWNHDLLMIGDGNHSDVPKDCSDLPDNAPSGVYTIYPISSTCGGFDVFCNMTMDAGGWTVLQRRTDKSTNFDRGWSDYEEGFGDLVREFWLGNRKIHQITSSGSYMLRIELRDINYGYAYAVYNNFSVGDAETEYTLNVNGYYGTLGDQLNYHNNMPFTTYDNDNDKSNGNCANQWSSGWWYNTCWHLNLNIPFITTSTKWGSLRSTMMAVKRHN